MHLLIIALNFLFIKKLGTIYSLNLDLIIHKKVKKTPDKFLIIKILVE